MRPAAIAVVLDFRFSPRDVEAFECMLCSCCSALRSSLLRGSAVCRESALSLLCVTISSEVKVVTALQPCTSVAVLRTVQTLQQESGTPSHPAAERSLKALHTVREALARNTPVAKVLLITCQPWEAVPPLVNAVAGIASAGWGFKHLLVSTVSSGALSPADVDALRITLLRPSTASKPLLCAVLEYLAEFMLPPCSRQMTIRLPDGVDLVVQIHPAVLRPSLDPVEACRCHMKEVSSAPVCGVTRRPLGEQERVPMYSVWGDLLHAPSHPRESPRSFTAIATGRVRLRDVPDGVLRGTWVLAPAMEGVSVKNASVCAAVSRSLHACDEAIVVVAPRSLSSGAELPIDEVVVLLGDPDGGPMVAHAVDPLEYSVFPYLPDPVAVDSVTEKVASTALRKLAPASFDDLGVAHRTEAVLQQVVKEDDEIRRAVPRGVPVQPPGVSAGGHQPLEIRRHTTRSKRAKPAVKALHTSVPSVPPTPTQHTTAQPPPSSTPIPRVKVIPVAMRP